MSELGGSSKSRASVEGTQRMAGGEVNSGCYADEEISSSYFEDIPSRSDAIGVITWLKPIEEDRVDSF